jgi:hypothetical protein
MGGAYSTNGGVENNTKSYSENPQKETTAGGKVYDY